MPVQDYQQRAAIQTALTNFLEGVTGVENVFDGIKRAKSPDEFVQAFVTSDGLITQGWFVYRQQTATRSSETHPGQVAIGTQLMRVHRFNVEGYYAYVEDVSEQSFQALCDDILTANDELRTMGTWQVNPLQGPTITYKELGGVLCHYGVFTLDAYENIEGLTPH